MKITNFHTLDIASQQILPGGRPMPVRRFLVIHYTAGWSAQSSVNFWKTSAARGANAHLVIDRDGSVIQCRRFNTTAAHAGVSRWKDPKTGKMYNLLNGCSIGIELANSGDMGRRKFPPTTGSGLDGKPVPVKTARHKNGGTPCLWEVYDPRQLDSLWAIAQLLVTRYKLDDVVGHDDISPNRKTDPGPLFPMSQFRAFLGFPPMLP
jgi:N-acetylmuramoyl-L-alanine amidase